MNQKKLILNYILIINQNQIYQVKSKIIHMKVKLINIIVNYQLMKMIIKAILIIIVI